MYPQLDMFDSNRAFGIQLPSIAQYAPALLYSLLALSARHMERKEGTKNSFDSLELYQQTIKLLTPLMQTRDPQSLPICVILCCLEMMSASPRDWRRHLEGCAALFDAFGVHGFSGDMDQAVFWCYARMGKQRFQLFKLTTLNSRCSHLFLTSKLTDLCGAFISDGTQSTLIPPFKWLPPEHIRIEEVGAGMLFRSTRSPDMYANYAVYLCARICELMSDRTRYVELGEDNGCTKQIFTRRWIQLWEELQNWRRERPIELLPIQTIDGKLFPEILFAHWAAISSNQLYHTGCILLLNCRPKSVEPLWDDIGSTSWHAKQICGISLTNPHQGCLANAIQPLWVAGRLLTHRSEQELIVKVIQGIETTTGWGSCWRISDLENVWGHKVL